MAKNITRPDSKHVAVKPSHRNKLGFIDPTVSGIDIGAELIHVSIPDSSGGTQVIEFGATTPQLYKVVNALKKAGVTTAVMEATGVYWVPLYEIAEQEGLKPVLVDAKSVKNVPGRKTDFQDCQWIQTLYSNGLLRAAFRPPRDRLPLRQYVRQRHNIIKVRQEALLRMDKALQLMNVKLSGALSDIGGISGLDIIDAILAGERHPRKLSKLRNKSCKKSEQAFVDALTGNFQKEHVFSLKQGVELYRFAEKLLIECDEEIRKELEALPDVTKEPPPKREKDKKANGTYGAARRKATKNSLSFNVRDLLWKKSGIDATALPGVEANTSLLLFAELGGTDVSAWRSEKAFASWLKLCPGNNISGGRRRKSRHTPCANYVTQALRMASLAAKRSKTAVGAFIRRITGREDKPKGIKAGAHSLACMYYSMCSKGWVYFERGEAYYEQAYTDRCLKNIKKKALELGYMLVPTQQQA